MNQFKVRLIFICFFIMVAGVAIIVRLFTVQVVQGPAFAERSRQQSQERCIIPAKRGDIRDRNGRVIAANTQDDLSLKADVLGITGDSGARREVKRAYPLEAAAAPLIGCVGKDGYGLSGAELAFDTYLRGEDGWTMVQRDGRNNRYRKIGLPSKEPLPGSTVYLTIDAEIQKAVYDVLRQSVETLKAHGGRCIVMDPASGNILAMVNEPSFDPNLPAGIAAIPPERQQNACINALYEPGSTFKLVTASAALQDNIKKETDILDGNQGSFTINHARIRDHEAFGKLTFAQALSRSSNVCFAKIALAIGDDRLYRYARNFGFGARSDIELPGEESGILHPIHTWSGRSLVTMAIGQEVSVTLLQMMVAYATIANHGVMVKPRIFEKAVAVDGTVAGQSAVAPVRRVVSEETARRLCVMLQGVVDSGTGRKAAIPHVKVAGKTGTAQKLECGAYSKTKSWVSFIGFLPADHPVLLCGVVIDEPAANLMGGTAAAPAFQKIVTRIISRPGLDYAERILNPSASPLAAEPGNAPMLAKGAGAVAAPAAPVASDSGTGGEGGYQVPDVCGKDARDAANLVNRQGLSPYVVGAGIVRRQSPPAGARMMYPQPCTLLCAYGKSTLRPEPVTVTQR